MRTFLLSFLLLTIIFITGAGSPAMACDSCNFFEYSLLENRPFFGIFYRSRNFNQYNSYGYTRTQASGINQSIFDPQMSIQNTNLDYDPIMHEPENSGLYVNKSRLDFENYYTVEFRGNITVKNKWNFTFLLPYEFNKVHYHEMLVLPKPAMDTTMSVQGWGDLTLAADFIHFIFNKKARHTLRPGMAVTAPTGQFNQVAKQTEAQSFLFDPVIQPSKGAWGFTGRINYQLFYTDKGVNAGFNYKIATEGAQEYRFGNSFNAYAVYFQQIDLGKNIILVPNGGFYYEHDGQDIWKAETQALTGGNLGFGQVGIDLNRNQYTLSFLWQKPVFQNLNGNQIHHQDRISLGLIRGFKL